MLSNPARESKMPHLSTHKEYGTPHTYHKYMARMYYTHIQTFLKQVFYFKRTPARKYRTTNQHQKRSHTTSAPLESSQRYAAALERSLIPCWRTGSGPYEQTTAMILTFSRNYSGMIYWNAMVLISCDKWRFRPAPFV
jgi:hypothetical protein